ncbi:MAG TPA: hypothetical protein VID20_04510, partial [Sphingomicrobium sp.]
MKLITSTALALVAAVSAAPAAAQYNNPSPSQQQQPTAGQQAAQPAAPQIKPSSKAAKAIIDLQTAVNNKDFANVPAKIAAAQVVATTKEDHYLIARLQLSAALANKDTAGMTAALDAIAASGVVDAAKTAELYSGLGGTFL